MLAIYTRVSTEEQADKGISLENQELRGIELAKKLKLLYKVYSDAGTSGNKPIEQRAGLLAMVNDIRSKIITTVYVLNQSRLDRGDALQFAHIKNIFKTCKTTLYYNTELIDYNNINVELTMDLQSVINNFYLKQTAESIRSNLEKAVNAGGVAGGPIIAYGFTKDEKKKMIVKESEAEIVKMIYKLALSGKGTKAIAKILNDLKVPTKRSTLEKGYLTLKGKLVTEFIWRDATIYRILTNSVYKGVRLFSGKPYPIEAIIDEATFSIVQATLKSNNRFKDTTNEHEYLLKGLIECPICGGIFYGKKRPDMHDHAYKCNSDRYGKNCGNRGIDIDYLDNLVIENVLKLDKLITTSLQNEMSNGLNNMYLKAYEETKEKIIDVNEKIESLISLIEDKEIDIAVFKSRIEQRQNELAELEIKEKRLYEQVNIFQHKSELVELAITSIKAFKKATKFEDKRNFLRNIIKRVSLHWNAEKRNHAIVIDFKIFNIENYLISKEIVVDRNSRKDGKAVSKVVAEGLELKNIVNFVPFEIPMLHYDAKKD